MRSRLGLPPPAQRYRQADKKSKPEHHKYHWQLQKLKRLSVLMALAIGLSWALDRAWPTTQKALNELRDSIGLTTSTTLPWQLAFDPPPLPAPANPELEPEPLVRQIYAQLGKGERAEAMATASLLVERFPTFQLGQLLYADLLNISSANPVAWHDMQELNAPHLHKRLDELILEAKRRLQNDSIQSLQGKIPAALAFLSPQQAYVAAIDTSKSRLYWFENRSGSDGRLRLHLVKESYISVGVNGVGKNKEGDGKTPLGVYFILRHLPGEGLPDLFGEGALILNYPNAIDVIRKKTGSGIWLHGTPSGQYARAPESTDGCVVLSNTEMSRLLKMPDLRMTPVIIAEQLDWIDADKFSQTWAAFKPSLDEWLQARKVRDPEALKIHYSARYEQDGMGLAQIWPRLVQNTLSYSQTQPLELMSVLNWKDQDHTMVVTMKDPNQNLAQGGAYLRMYWQKENGQWRIVFQGPT